MAERKISDIKSSLLKAISEHLDSMEQAGSAGARAARDLYSRTGPGDNYSRTTPRVLTTFVAEDTSLE
jgi:hypothetical protein